MVPSNDPKLQARPGWSRLAHTTTLKKAIYVPLALLLAVVAALTMRTQMLRALGLWTGLPIHSHALRSPLVFSADGRFKISIFEDLHFGEDESSTWAPQADAQTLRVMTSLLDVERPDLVVLNGDLVTGDNTYLHNSTDYIDMLVSPLVASGTPWASTYGNHDISFNSSTSAFLERERAYPLSHTDQLVFGSKAGVSNYFLPVFKTPSSTEPALILWFFDSQGGHAYQQHDSDSELIDLPAQVEESVVERFSKTSAALYVQYSSTIPGLAFVHIPTSHMAAFSSAHELFDPHHQPGLRDEIDFDPQRRDVSFVNALLANEDLLAVFSGHQHGNDWCMSTAREKAPPLFACFGRHTGYGGYGNWERGARQVILDLSTLKSEGREIETWVRLERGGVSGHVTLNATYGVDRYKKIRRTFTHLDNNGNVVDGEQPGPASEVRFSADSG